MIEDKLDKLACPRCKGDLYISAIKEMENGCEKEGTITCRSCKRSYEIDNFLPRFVRGEDYTRGFGFQWNRHSKTQYDSNTGLDLSRKRFYGATRWTSDLKGEVVLEAGCGSGRFTEIAAETDAFVVSLDHSSAVDANYSANGMKRNVLIVQGDLYNMPLRSNYFDKIFCFGTLQHTPNVQRAFMSLLEVLKPGGELVIDVYKRTFLSTWLSTKYYVRPFTSGMRPEMLYRLVTSYIDMMWPISMWISRIPKVGRPINHRLLVAEHSNQGVTGDILKEMAYLDAFDMLSPEYDKPQTKRNVTEWFVNAGMEHVEVKYGFNGIVGRGSKPEQKKASDGTRRLAALTS